VTRNLLDFSGQIACLNRDLNPKRNHNKSNVLQLNRDRTGN